MNTDSKKPNGPYEIKINEKLVVFNKPQVTGREILEHAEMDPVECHSLYQKIKGYDFEYIALTDTVDLSNEEIEHYITNGPVVFNYTVNKEPETTDSKFLTPAQIILLAGLNRQEVFLLEISDEGEINLAYKLEEPIKMRCPALKFRTEKWIELANIEELGKTCQPVPTAKLYRIKIDKSYHNVASPYITGEGIIKLENKPSNTQYNVLKFLSSDAKPKPVGLQETIDLREKCLVRFVIQPKEQKDGQTAS